MSQQGGKPTGHDDWWKELYDDSTDDTGPTPTPDSLDDRFASAAHTVSGPPATPPQPTPGDPAQAPAPAPGDGTDRHLPAPPETRRPPGRTPDEPYDIPGPRVGPPRPADPPRPWWEPAPTSPPGPGPAPSASPVSGPPEPGASGGERLVSPETGGPIPGGPRPGGPRPEDGRPGGPAAGVPGPESEVAANRGPGDPHSRGPYSRDPRSGDPRSAVPRAGVPQPEDRRSGTPRPDTPPRPALGPENRPPAAPTPASATRNPDTPTAPGPGGPWPRGRTVFGRGPGDLSESEPPSSGPAGLPPLPPPFLPLEGGGGRDYVGSGPPTYDPEPTALPGADPDGLDDLVPDTVLEGARYGACTLRAASVRGDSARYRGEPRRDALLVARFGAGEQALVLVAMATGARATAGAHRAAAEVCRWIGSAVGRSHARLAEDLRAGRRGELRSGLHRLTDRSLGRLRAGAAEQGLPPDAYTATLRCLLLPADPACRTRVFFGVGAGGLLRLRDGAWQDMEPTAGDLTGGPVLGVGAPAREPQPARAPDRLTTDLGITSPAPEPPRRPFRFRASTARPGDVLLMCTAGLAEPLLTEPRLGELLAGRWADPAPPGLPEFLADSRVRVKGHADDRTAAAVWEA